MEKTDYKDLNEQEVDAIFAALRDAVPGLVDAAIASRKVPLTVEQEIKQAHQRLGQIEGGMVGDFISDPSQDETLEARKLKTRLPRLELLRDLESEVKAGELDGKTLAFSEGKIADLKKELGVS